MKSGGGLITHKDLKNYKVVTRKPIIGNYKGYELYAMSPSFLRGGAYNTNVKYFKWVTI